MSYELIKFYQEWLEFKNYYAIQKRRISDQTIGFFNHKRYLPEILPSNSNHETTTIEAKIGDVRIDVPVWFGDVNSAKHKLLFLGLEPRHTNNLFNIERIGNKVFASPFGIDRWASNAITRHPQNKYYNVFKEVIDRKDLFIVFSDAVKHYNLELSLENTKNDHDARKNFNKHLKEELIFLHKEINLISPDLIITLGNQNHYQLKEVLDSNLLKKIRHPAYGGVQKAIVQLNQLLLSL